MLQCDVAVTEAGQFLLQVGRKATDCKTSEDTTNLIHSLELYRTQFAREQGEKLAEMSRIAISVFGEKCLNFLVFCKSFLRLLAW